MPLSSVLQTHVFGPASRHWGTLARPIPPPLIYYTTTLYHRFQQPEWMAEHALPPPSDVFGVDGVTVGRTVGLLGFCAGSALAGSAMNVLGDQLEVIGVSFPHFYMDHGYLPAAYDCSGP